MKFSYSESGYGQYFMSACWRTPQCILKNSNKFSLERCSILDIRWRGLYQSADAPYTELDCPEFLIEFFMSASSFIAGNLIIFQSNYRYHCASSTHSRRKNAAFIRLKVSQTFFPYLCYCKGNLLNFRGMMVIKRLNSNNGRAISILCLLIWTKYLKMLKHLHSTPISFLHLQDYSTEFLVHPITSLTEGQL